MQPWPQGLQQKQKQTLCCGLNSTIHLHNNKFTVMLLIALVHTVNKNITKTLPKPFVRFKLITNSIQSNPISPRHWYQTTRLK